MKVDYILQLQRLIRHNLHFFKYANRAESRPKPALCPVMGPVSGKRITAQTGGTAHGAGHLLPPALDP
jgi:hypothetical protein